MRTQKKWPRGNPGRGQDGKTLDDLCEMDHHPTLEATHAGRRDTRRGLSLSVQQRQQALPADRAARRALAGHDSTFRSERQADVAGQSSPTSRHGPPARFEVVLQPYERGPEDDGTGQGACGIFEFIN